MTESPVTLASEIQPGRYICLKTRSPLGWLIRVVCRSPFDHAALVTAPGVITEATLRGVRQSPLPKYRGCFAAVNAAEIITGEQAAAIVIKGRAFARDEYAFPLLIVIALRKLGIKWRWILRLAEDRDAVICSELVAASGQVAYLDWLCGESSPETVRPDQLGARLAMRRLYWDIPG